MGFLSSARLPITGLSMPSLHRVSADTSTLSTKKKLTDCESDGCARRWLIRLAASAVFAAVMSSTLFAQDPLPIKEVLLVHFAHTDFGYTDQPEVVRELHRHYVDIALDAAWATRLRPEGDRFCWTIEAQYSFADWWKAATPARRAEFVEMVRAGQLDVS